MMELPIDRCLQVRPFASHSITKVTQYLLVVSCISRVLTWSMTISFQDVEGLLERASLSTDVRPSLKQLYHSFICVVPIASFPKAC